MSGVEFATLIRKSDNKTRIVISTAYTNKEFMLQAIELDLTRYLVKPLTNEDLVQAFEKCWRELEDTHTVTLAEGYRYNRTKASLFRDDEEIVLRHKELKILEYLIEHEEEVVRYEWLEEHIWENDVMSRDAIRSQIRNLRKKLELDFIENISGVGYRFSRKVEG